MKAVRAVVDRGARAERLGAFDAAFLAIESPRTPMHMGFVGIFEGGPLLDGGRLRAGEIRAEIERRLPALPRLSERIVPGFHPWAHPAWEHDPAFRIDRRVRVAALPAPGGERELVQLCAELLAAPLDRAHPLWELWLVEGLERGRVAVVAKIHHALADGLGGVDLLNVLLDAPPGAAGGRGAARARRGPVPAGRGVEGAVGHPGPPSGPTLRSWVHDPVRSVRRTGTVVGAATGALLTLATPRTIAPRSSLNARVGGERRVALLRRPLEGVHSTAHRLGATVNDVLLAAVAGGARELIAGRGGETARREIQVAVPVAVGREPGRRMGNALSVLALRLPLGIDDPVVLLHAVAEQASSRKGRHQELAGVLAIRAFGLMPALAQEVVAPILNHQPVFNMITTDVPGPPGPLSLFGARMLAAYPFVPLGGNLTLEVAALSYDTGLHLGILADWGRCPDLEVFVDGVGRTFAALESASVAGGGTGAGRTPVGRAG